MIVQGTINPQREGGHVSEVPCLENMHANVFKGTLAY